MEERYKTFTLLISKISRCIRKIKTNEVEEVELKSPHVSCLYYLYQQDGMTSKELCDICDEDKGAISRSIEFLRNKGFIEMSSNSEKRHKSPLNLTQKGKEIGLVLSQKIDKVLETASVGLSEENRKNFYDSLILISNNLQKICDKYGDDE